MSGDMYEHFSHDERDFVDKANDWVERASKVHDMKLTDFLDPRQVFILQSLVNRSQDVQVRFDGGYEGAERKRALIALIIVIWMKKIWGCRSSALRLTIRKSRNWSMGTIWVPCSVSG